MNTSRIVARCTAFGSAGVAAGQSALIGRTALPRSTAIRTIARPSSLTPTTTGSCRRESPEEPQAIAAGFAPAVPIAAARGTSGRR